MEHSELGESPRRRGGVALGGALTALVLLGGLLAGCGGGNGGEQGAASGSTARQTSASASATAGHEDGASGHDDSQDDVGATQKPFPADTNPDTQPASADAFGNVTDIRIGHHDGFDRVVLQFGGRGTPGWDVRYVDRPASQGSGAPVDLPGDATLQATVTGVGLPPDTGVAEYSGPKRITPHGTDAVTAVQFDGTFEGTTLVFVGTASTTPFRVYLLQNPVRIVVDVAAHSTHG